MKLKFLCCFFFLLIGLLGFGQSVNKKSPRLKFESLSLSVTNSHTAMPYASFSGLLFKEYHPGVEIGTGFTWKEKKKHDWFQTIKTGYSYHQFVQHSWMLYTELGYRYKLPAGFSANAKLGAGYLHSKEDSEVFILGEDGQYKKSEKFGRSHGMASFSIGAAKNIGTNGWQIFMDYQQRFQIGFIDAYVPALPVNTLSIGVSVPLRKK